MNLWFCQWKPLTGNVLCQGSRVAQVGHQTWQWKVISLQHDLTIYSELEFPSKVQLPEGMDTCHGQDGLWPTADRIPTMAFWRTASSAPWLMLLQWGRMWDRPHIFFFCKSSVLIPCSKHNFQDSHGNYIRKSNYPEVIGDDRWNATSKCQSKLGRPTLMYPVKSKVVMSGVQRETKEDLS
jgi:hypothetical protein